MSLKDFSCDSEHRGTPQINYSPQSSQSSDTILIRMKNCSYYHFFKAIVIYKRYGKDELVHWSIPRGYRLIGLPTDDLLFSFVVFISLYIGTLIFFVQNYQHLLDNLYLVVSCFLLVVFLVFSVFDGEAIFILWYVTRKGYFAKGFPNKLSLKKLKIYIHSDS